MQNVKDVYWIKIKKLINARSQRERILMLVTGLALIWTMLFNGIITPSKNAFNDNSEEKQNLEQEYHATKHEVVLLRERLQRESYPKPNSEMQQLQDILQEHNKMLERFHEKFIKPEQVPHLLDNLLTDFSGLVLLNIETLVPQALVQDKLKTDFETSAVYRHGIRMTFQGEYKDLLAYVKKIEQLPYPLWWDDVEYSLSQFPQAKIVLTIYTLSQHKNWIGV